MIHMKSSEKKIKSFLYRYNYWSYSSHKINEKRAINHKNLITKGIKVTRENLKFRE